MKTEWHCQSLGEVYKRLNSSPEGISNIESKKRLKKFGANELAQHKKQNFILIFLNQFSNPLVYILLIASVLTYFLGHILDTIVIIVVVLTNAFLGLLHEFKAEKSMEALIKLMALKTKAVRNGVLEEIFSSDLVPGDIVELSEGNKIPADIRIIEQNNLLVDQSVLTGESVPQNKSIKTFKKNVALGDRDNMLFGGTVVISGKAKGIVVATGKETQFGKIGEEVTQTREEKTPLQSRIALFAKKLLFVVLIAVSVIFVVGILKKIDAAYVFLTALSVAISAIPEGLPAIITITLATGAFRMAKRHAIIRKLVAVETLGSITTIASDKTGTLTQNQMTIKKLYSHQERKIYQISGAGYKPKGDFSPPPTQNIIRLLSYSASCSDAEIFEKNSEWGVSGDPTEGAIVSALEKSGTQQKEVNKNLPRLDEIPFNAQKGFMATLHQNGSKNLLIVKGKIEEILEMSDLPATQKKKINEIAEEFALSALRVLAVGIKELDGDDREIASSELNNLSFLGFFGMIDPPREEATEAIKICQKSGIKPIMITGDHELTALAIAKQLGIAENENQIISSEEIDKMSPGQFTKSIKNYTVFARISPEMKLKIISALQQQNEIVAVTGDGINDAPALKKADVGIAMGEGGTDASKEVSDLVLTDNNFTTITAAIEEGRTILQNIRRVIFYLLSTNFGELFIIFTAMIIFKAPYDLPLLPVQILWLNLVTDGTNGTALALEPTHKGVIKYSPRSPKEGILNNLIYFRIFLVALTMLVCTIILYGLEVKSGTPIDKARTIAFTLMVLLQIYNVLNCRSFRESIFKTSFFSNKYILFSITLSLFLSAMTIYFTPMQKLFHTVALAPNEIIKIILICFAIIFVVEIEKWIRRRLGTKY